MLVGFDIDAALGSSGFGVGGLRKKIDYENYYMHTKWESTLSGRRSEISRLVCLDLSETSPLRI